MTFKKPLKTAMTVIVAVFICAPSTSAGSDSRDRAASAQSAANDALLQANDAKKKRDDAIERMEKATTEKERQEAKEEAMKYDRQFANSMDAYRRNTELAQQLRNPSGNSGAAGNAKSATSQPAEVSAQQSNWKPVEGHQVDGRQVFENPKTGEKFAPTEGGNGYSQKPGEGWTSRPAESVGFGEGSSKVNAGGNSWEMTGKSINNGAQSVPQYQLPDGSKGFVDAKGNWQQMQPGNDYYTKTALPEGFKMGENGRLAGDVPSAVQASDLATMPSRLDPSVSASGKTDFNFSVGSEGPLQPVFNSNGRVSGDFVNAARRGEVTHLVPEVTPGKPSIPLDLPPGVNPKELFRVSPNPSRVFELPMPTRPSGNAFESLWNPRSR